MEKILELIEKYNQIILYRHVNPDLDAFGSQLGMYFVLKQLYPNKRICLQGERTSDLLKFYDEFEVLDPMDEKSLGIVLDTANKDRIDGELSYCDKLIKIDHHIVVDSYGDINIVDEKASSCSEIVTLLMKEKDIEIPQSGAKALYLGIVGDSNRFMYSSTSHKTFEAAGYLMDSGIDITKLYQALYVRSLDDLKVSQFIYTNYKLDNGVAWYYLSQEDLDQLGMTREQGSQYVNTLANYEEIKIWMAVTQNVKDNNYRVSIRTRDTVINDIAAEFNGGGHAFASGATLNDLSELDLLVNKLKERING